ncbi:GNAT family N-acetyltransferase [Diplocloster agilis]|uniref:N-acetyltransferase n=1 Tax=Diplocloster agilis TaxID=2850323 RepID=A0A949NA09_9FIRM|nr:GNAT family N-acetyltransferase [Diplocloster agilis]MBU9735962.1 N-acetyltransferase [Diplocloster agilis]
MDFIRETNRIYQKDESGKLLAEITFPEVMDHIVNINHTFVDESLGGRGIAGQLVHAAAEQIRASNLKCVCTCSYASRWFGKHPEFQDILCKDH